MSEIRTIQRKLYLSKWTRIKAQCLEKREWKLWMNVVCSWCCECEALKWSIYRHMRLHIQIKKDSHVKNNIVHFFKKFKPNLLLFAYDKRSTLYFSNISNLIFYFLHMTKGAHFTFQIFQTKSSTFCISLKKHQSLLKIFK